MLRLKGTGGRERRERETTPYHTHHHGRAAARVRPLYQPSACPNRLPTPSTHTPLCPTVLFCIYASYTCTPQARDAGFRVVVVYPYVKVKTLLERAHARQKETGQIAAPDDDIRATASLAALDVEPLFNYFLWDPSKNCMEGKDVIKSPRKCDDAIKTSRLYLWDNNGEKNKETIIAALEASYPSPHIVAVSPHCGPASAKGQWDPDDTAGAVLKVFVETRVGRATCAGMWGGRTAKILDDKGLLARLLKHRTSDLKRAAAVKGGLTASYT